MIHQHKALFLASSICTVGTVGTVMISVVGFN